MSKKYLAFVKETLIPRANEILQQKYDTYCNGEDIGIKTKDDATPASFADRETESTLRELIMQKYPNHGIWGEEYGASNIDRDWVWALDPLDGTKEFLAKQPSCFGTLIGLFYKGRAVLGSISDPINNKIWLSNARQPLANTKSLAKSIVACTNPKEMFPTPKGQLSIQRVQSTALELQTKLNCIGFANIVDGTVDAVIEDRLNLHDIAALIPVLQSARATVIDLNGNDYRSMAFDLSNAQTQKYNIIAAANSGLAQEILSIFQKQEEAA